MEKVRSGGRARNTQNEDSVKKKRVCAKPTFSESVTQHYAARTKFSCGTNGAYPNFAGAVARHESQGATLWQR